MMIMISWSKYAITFSIKLLDAIDNINNLLGSMLIRHNPLKIITLTDSYENYH